VSVFLKPLGWNGIHSQIPLEWDVIVKEAKHLIFEEGLRPVLEFRWQNPKKVLEAEKQRAFIFSQLIKETGKTPKTIKTPRYLRVIASKYHITAFSTDSSTHAEGAILICNQCGALLLFRFFPNSFCDKNQLADFFTTLQCHSSGYSEDSWAIQDITFILPQHFSLKTFSFSLGVSQLIFTSKSTALKLCRIASASEQLKQTSLADLFTSFSGADPEGLFAVNDNTLQFNHQPHLIERLYSRLKRQKPYRWAIIEHFSHKNRILGIVMESRKPFEPGMKEMIHKNYGIF